MYITDTEEELARKQLAKTRRICADSRNKANAGNVPGNVKALHAELEELVRSAFIQSRVFPNVNIRTVQVKVEKPTMAGRLAADASKDLQDFIKQHNVTVNDKKVGVIIYHIPYSIN